MEFVTLLLILAAVCVIALLCFHLETKYFVIRRYPIASRKLPEAFCGVKLALITDLHSTVYGKNNQKLLSAIAQEQPDYILIAGDMLVAKPGADFTPAVDFLQAISAAYPVYYSYGNHECRLQKNKRKYGDMAKQYEQAIAGLPLHMLHNQKLCLERGEDKIWIYGLEIAQEYYLRFKNYKMTGDYLKKKLGKKEDGYSILIAHNPYYFSAYAQWGAELVVSGHNHGGIVHVPFLGGLVDPNLRLFPKYDKGLFGERESQMVLSGGVGSHNPNFRAWNLPELVILTLTGESTGDEYSSKAGSI